MPMLRGPLALLLAVALAATTVVAAEAAPRTQPPPAGALTQEQATPEPPEVGTRATGWFEPNRGQLRADADYLGRGATGGVLLSAGTATSVVTGEDGQHTAVTWRLVGADDAPAHTAGDTQAATSNYLAGGPSTRATDVPHHGSVRYHEVLPGVDVVWRADEQQRLAYDLHLDPGVPAGDVELAYDGARDLTLASNGDLLVHTASGVFRQTAPVSYQPTDDGDRPVASRFRVDGLTAHIEVDDRDLELPLVIDPTYELEQGTYLGGAGYEYLDDMAVYDTGEGTQRVAVLFHDYSSSRNDPSAKDDPTTTGGDPIFSTSAAAGIAELDLAADGDAQLRSLTYVGDYPEEMLIAYGPDGRLHLAMETYGGGFPVTENGFDTEYQNPRDGGDDDEIGYLVLDMDRSGDEKLRYGTYFGGTEQTSVDYQDGTETIDREQGIGALAVGDDGRAYLVANTDSYDLPVTDDAYDRYSDRESSYDDVFLAVFDPDLIGAESLAYATYISADEAEDAADLAIGPDGDVWIAATTDLYGAGFPLTADAWRTREDVDRWTYWVARFDITREGDDQLRYATYVGGTDDESNDELRLDVGANGNVYVAGYSQSNDLPMRNGHLATGDERTNGFLQVFDPSLAPAEQLIHGTWLVEDEPNDLTVDDDGIAYLPWRRAEEVSDGYDIHGEVIAIDPSRSGDASVSTAVHAMGTGARAAHYEPVSGRLYVGADSEVVDHPWITSDAYQTEPAAGRDAIVASFIIADDVEPTWPGDAAVTVDAVGSSFVELSWSAATDDRGVDAYRILDATAEPACEAGEVLLEVPGDETSASVSGLEPETTYDLHVVAQDANGNVDLAAGPCVEVTTTDTDVEPGTASLSVTPAPGGVAELLWDPATGTDLAGYRINRTIGDGEREPLADITDPSATTWSDSGLPAGTRVTYQVNALRETAGEPDEQPHTTTTSATTPPLHLDEVVLEGDRTRYGDLETDGTVTITATGETGRSTTAELTVTSWYEDADTNAQLLGSPATATRELTLVERPAGSGVYTADTDLAGIAEVVGLTATLTDGHGAQESTSAANLPLTVAGTLEVAVDAPAWQVPDATVHARRLDGHGARVEAVADPASLVDLPPSRTYELRVLDRDGRVLVELDGVTVRGGLSDELTLSPTPRIPLDIRVVDGDGGGIETAKVTVTDPATDEEVLVASSGEGGRVRTAWVRGDTARVRVEPPLPRIPYDQVLTLDSFPDELVVTPDTAAASVVSGTVTDPDGDPVAGAQVSVTTLLDDGRASTNTTRSLANGTYALDAHDGEVTVTAVDPRWARTSATVPVSGDTLVDVSLEDYVTAPIDVELWTQYAGDELRRVEIDWTVGVHMGLWARSAIGGRAISSERVLMRTQEPGTDITVCADGHEANLPRACTEVYLEPGMETPPVARVELVEAARVATRVDDPLDGGWKAYLVEVDADGERGATVDHLRGTGTRPIELSAEAPGDHVVVVYADGGRSVEHPVSLPAHEVTDLATLTLPSTVEHLDGAATMVTVTPGTAGAGDTVSVRARMSLDADASGPVTGAVAEVTVPPGTSFVAGSATVDGASVSATATDTTVRVPVGGFGGNSGFGEAVIRLWLRLEEDVEPGPLTTVVTVDHEYDGTPFDVMLGTADVDVPGVTLVANDTTADRQLPVSGRAGAGALVRVFADGAVVGSAVATPGGLWSTTVTLPETQLPHDHVLHAEVENGGEVRRSEARRVNLDPTHPSLTEVVITQDGGREARIDPTDGVARFPYVFRPGQRFEMSTSFDAPERVENVVAHIGDVRAVLSAEAGGTFAADGVHVDGRDLGPIYVTWDTTPEVLDLAPDEQQDPLTDTQARALLSSPLDSFVPDSGDAETAGASTTTASRDAQVLLAAARMLEAAGTESISESWAVPELGDDARVEVTITSERIDYEPTAQDLADARDTGVNIYGVSNSGSIGTTSMTTSASGIVMQSDVADDDPQNVSLSGRRATPYGGGRVMFAAAAPAARVGFTVAFTGADSGDALYGAFGVDDKLDRLGDLRDLGQGCGGTAAGAPQRADRIARDIMVAEATKAGMTLAGTLAAPATFGLGTLGIWAFGWGVGKLIDHSIDERIDDLADDIAEARGGGDCPEDEDDDDRDDDNDRPNTGPVAEPRWIHDPSGYVFELFTDDRLEGVTATVQRSTGDHTGPWHTWDAEWFGQQNPLVTDPAGRYGWDVPEGWWRVRYDHPAYATAYSDALEVLPPHFDVNVGLERLAGADVTGGTAEAGETTIEVSFDTWMRAVLLDDTAVSLADGDGNPVPFGLDLSDTRSHPSTGESLTRGAILDLDRPLVAGETFTVIVDRTVETYATRPMDADAEIEITVTAADTDDPDGGVDGDESGGDADGRDEGANDPEPAPVDPEARPDLRFGCPAADVPEGTFDDVDPDDPHGRAIDCAAWWGVTRGTGEGYAPSRAVSRGQMATFLIRLLEGSGAEVPSSPPDAFDDDETSVHEASGDALAALGIMHGVAPRRFDADAPVTRAQTAELLVATYEHIVGKRLPSGDDAFGDDDGSVHEAAIDAAAAAGFATGTSTSTYAPERSVNRAQMASLLMRAMDALVQYGHADDADRADGPNDGTQEASQVDVRARRHVVRTGGDAPSRRHRGPRRGVAVRWV